MVSVKRASVCGWCPRNIEDRLHGGCSQRTVHDRASATCSRCGNRRSVQPGITTSGLLSTEVNGFVSWIASYAFSLCFLVWALVPHEYLHQLSISYVLNTYWALAVPALVFIGLVATFLMYNALNLLSVRPLESFCLVSDESATLASPERLEELHATAALASAAPGAVSQRQPVKLAYDGVLFPDIQDIPLSLVNQIMFPVPDMVDGNGTLRNPDAPIECTYRDTILVCGRQGGEHMVGGFPDDITTCFLARGRVTRVQSSDVPAATEARICDIKPQP